MSSVTGRTKAVLTALLFITSGFLMNPYIALADETKETAQTQESEEESAGRGGGYAASGQMDKAGYSAQIYDATNGLPTSDANNILAASDGYVWIGGYSGIIRYDGSSFERLDTAGGLTSGRDIFEDSRHRIWVATNDNGVVILDGNESTHITYKEGLTSSSIRTFAEDRMGNVYIGSTAGVSYVDSLMNLHVVDDDRINNERVLRLVTDPRGRVYGQTKEGSVFAIDRDKILQFYSSDDLGVEKITTILADPEEAGKIYFGTESNVVYYGAFGMPASQLKKISVDPCEGVHWMSYDCGRVWVSSTTVLGYIDEYGKYREVDHLPMNSAIEMHTSDYQGNLWVASSTQGVMKIVTDNFDDITRKAGIRDEVVNATCFHNGRLYIGTDRGLEILLENNRSYRDDLTAYINGARIRCILSDSAGNLWISTFTHDLGLVCQDKSGNIRSYTVADGMPSNEVRCVTEGADGSILVGTNGGLAVLKDGRILKTVGEEAGIKNTVFLTVAEGQDGEIYVGTDGGGIYLIEGDDVKTIGRDDGLTSDVVMRIKKDDVYDDLLWIVTSNSIEYMRNGVITNVTSFPYNNNYDLYFDDNSDIWVLSSYGLYCVEKDAMLADSVTDYRLYTTANGMTCTPTSNSYSTRDDKGDLYICGRTGVSTVNINHFFEGGTDIKTDIRRILCNSTPVLPDDDGVYTIPAETGRIQITPAILDYTMTNPLVRVYLEGADDAGITTQMNRLTPLEFTNLKYGNYTLHIQILSNSTKEVVQDEKYSIVKKPVFSELIIFRVLVVVLLAIFAGLIVWRVMSGTIIRRQYEQIRQAKDEAERANTAKSRFLANMSHEIRTPINTIMGMDEMILREDATDVPHGYFMSVINYALDIRNASESLLGLINDLLDMSKIESGKMNLVEIEYDVVDLLRSTVSMIRVRSAEKDLTFEVIVDEILPTRLYGDSGKIKQIVLNLLTNAVKYTSVGGLSLDVSVDGRTDDEVELSFKVKDTGMGIKDEDMERLFTAYERLEEEKNTGIQGTGLGLDISRRFAELMGGQLKCTSVYGEGSEFILSITQRIVDKTPIGVFREHDDNEAKGPYVPQFVAPDADVLVVDDNPMNLNVIKGLLKATKMFVTTAESGEECLDKLKYSTFNIVLLDHMMPGMDGVETLERIRKDFPDLPVYALTANTTAGEEFYKSKGFTGYLQKPIDSMALEKAIMKHLPEEIMMKATTADAVEEMTELPEDLQWVKEVEGLSVDDGIKNAGGIGGFIHAINMFYDTIDDNSKVINDAYKGDDIRLYTIKVHSLKTSARIVGALSLSELAQKIEDAGNKGDKSFIDENGARLLVQYQEFKDKLGRLRKEDEAAEGLEEIPENELKDAYAALKEVIPQMDYDAVEMILDQLKEYKLPEEDAARMAELGKLLKAFKWDEMEEMINKI